MKRIIALIITVLTISQLFACSANMGPVDESPVSAMTPVAEETPAPWQNPQKNKWTLTRLRATGRGENASGYKVAFFPPESMDGVTAYMAGYSVCGFDEVWEYLKGLSVTELFSLDKPVNRAYIMTDLSYADGVGNTLNTDQKDIVTGEDFSSSGVHYFYAATLGENGLLALEMAAQTVTVSPRAEKLVFSRAGNTITGSFISYMEADIMKNYVFVSSNGYAQMKAQADVLTPQYLADAVAKHACLAFDNAVNTDFSFNLNELNDIDGKPIDGSVVYYIYLVSVGADSNVTLTYCNDRFITPTELPASSGTIGSGVGIVFPNGGAAGIGGGRESIISTSQGIFRDFPDKPRIAVIGSSSGSEREICSYFYVDDTSVDSYEHRFAAAGFEPVYIPLTVDNRASVGNDAYFAALVRSCHAVYITGGDQSCGMYSLMNEDGSFNAIGNAMLDLFASGGVLAGTSAGAHMLGDRCFQDADSIVSVLANSPDEGNVSKSTLVGIPNGIIYGGIPSVIEAAGESVIFDSHFGARGRLGRLAVMQHATGSRYAIGLDEATGIAISAGIGTVYGQGTVLIIDNSEAVYGEGDSLSVSGLKLTLICAGDSFDFSTATLIPANDRGDGTGVQLSETVTEGLLLGGSAQTKAMLEFALSTGEERTYIDAGTAQESIVLTLRKSSTFTVLVSDRSYTYSPLAAYLKTAISGLVLEIEVK